MKKNIIITMAAISLMACTGKSEKEGAAITADSTKTEQIAEEPQSEEQAVGVSLEDAQLAQQSWPVTGGVSAKNFCRALLPGYHSFYAEDPANVDRFFTDEEGTLVVDEKNGYVSKFFEGAGSENFEQCYWKRTDGSILVALATDWHDLDLVDDKDVIIKTSHINFFIYDQEQHILEPTQQPFTLASTADQHVVFTLPQQGKDIEYVISAKDDEDDHHADGTKVLKYNGMTFE